MDNTTTVQAIVSSGYPNEQVLKRKYRSIVPMISLRDEADRCADLS